MLEPGRRDGEKSRVLQTRSGGYALMLDPDEHEPAGSRV